jgi:hypothetical protein
MKRRSVLEWLADLADPVTAGKRVDPAAFPEDEYPVRCLECGYDLRRLPDGRCPECGEAFERGRLLVEEYARGRLPRNAKWTRRASCIGILVLHAAYAPFLIVVVWAYWETRGGPSFPMEIALPWTLGGSIVGASIGLALSIFGVILAERVRPPREKRRLVRTTVFQAWREDRAQRRAARRGH